METEKRLAQYVIDTAYEDLPEKPISVVKDVTLAVLGTTLAGANAEGCRDLVRQVRQWGGRKEATILIHGGKVPAYNAALVNSTMARAVDFCDGMVPGMHVGSSSVPTALAAAELAGGCSGKEFLTSLVVGTEIASRLNAVSVYDGFDPTGVCTIFAATAITGRILRLDKQQMLNAMALVFNRAGGSMQSNIDGSLAVRVIQGFASQSGIICAQLAQRGITGPRNFLEGIYGYFHLYAKDKYNTEPVTGDLGKLFEMEKTLFKKYPSCGGTLAPTDAVLGLVHEENLRAEDVARIDIKVSPHVFKLVGGLFEVGENPKVNAQFNIQYCVANALLRRSSRLCHFDEAEIRDPKIMELVKVVDVSPDPDLDDPARGRFSIGARVKVTTHQGKVYDTQSADIPRGHPGNPLTQEEHLERFRDCVEYGNISLPAEQIEKTILMVSRLEEIEDVCRLTSLLSVKKGRERRV